MSSSPPAVFSVLIVGVITSGREVLLVRRRDTGLWELPGGVLRPGESVVEALRRLVEQDAGVVVAALGLSGIYTRQMPRLTLVFRSHQVTGSVTAGPAISECRWVDVEQVEDLVSISASQQVRDALLPQTMWPTLNHYGIPKPRVAPDNRLLAAPTEPPQER